MAPWRPGWLLIWVRKLGLGYGSAVGSWVIDRGEALTFLCGDERVNSWMNSDAIGDDKCRARILCLDIHAAISAEVEPGMKGVAAEVARPHGWL